MANKPAKPIPIPKNNAQYIKLFKKGQKLRLEKQHAEALQYLNAAWKYSDDDPALVVMISDSLFNIGNKSAAINLMIHVVETNPDDTNIVLTLGNAALDFEEFELAQKFHQKYIELKPSDPIGYNNYATALREDGKIDEAIEFLQSMLPVFPDDDRLWNTLAGIVGVRDGPENAIVFFEQCLKLNPENVQAWNNIAPAYVSINDFDGAEEALTRAIELDPDLPDPHLHYSALLLTQKKLKKGWEEYRHRQSIKQFHHTQQHNKIPYWQGEDLKGKKIAIFAEQGVGDEILFSWLFDHVIELADEVAITCQRRLLDLFKNSFPKAGVSKSEYLVYHHLDKTINLCPDVDISQFDYQCLAGDLPYYLWENYSDVQPTSEPILKPAQEKINFWRKEIDDLPGEISVGIAWRSGIRLTKRARNYASLLEWEPILKHKNINFINIQYGECEAELEELEKETGIKIHNFKDLNLKDDFEGTTAMISSLDLVVGPSSSPIMQAAFVGTDAWYFTNGSPWWAFGDSTPKWMNNARVFAKNPNTPWADYLLESSDDFNCWLETKRNK
mgnify:CR=1 FL=1